MNELNIFEIAKLLFSLKKMKKDELFETMMDGSSSFSKKMRSKILEFKFHDVKQNSLVISNKRDT